MANPFVPFESDMMYHVYNCGNGGEEIFRQYDNYLFFLKGFANYICPVANIYAYCLIPNHFHFLLRIKNEETVHKFAKETQTEEEKTPKIVSGQFKNFLISYSKSFNKYHNRKGNLFQKNLKRKKVDKDEYYTNMIRYIHFNAVLHGLADHPMNWRYSSYHSYINNTETQFLQKNEVIQWFGDFKAFMKFHKDIQEDEIELIQHLTFDE